MIEFSFAGLIRTRDDCNIHVFWFVADIQREIQTGSTDYSTRYTGAPDCLACGAEVVDIECIKKLCFICRSINIEFVCFWAFKCVHKFTLEDVSYKCWR